MLTDEVKGLNLTEEKRRDNSTVFRCCSGYCVDLVIINKNLYFVKFTFGQCIFVANFKVSYLAC